MGMQCYSLYCRYCMAAALLWTISELLWAVANNKSHSKFILIATCYLIFTNGICNSSVAISLFTLCTDTDMFFKKLSLVLSHIFYDL